MSEVDSVDVDRLQAVVMIRAAELRVIEQSDQWTNDGVCALEQIKLAGENEWRALCRTDECDDVCTSEVLSVAKAKRRGKNYWCKQAQIGARIYNDRKTFAVIDSATDG